MLVLGNLARKRGRLPIIIVLVISFIMMTSSQANAHVVYDWHWEYRSHEVCLNHKSEISHGSGGGYAKQQALIYGYAIYPGYTVDCGWPNTYPPGYIAVNMTLWRWSSAAGYWYACRSWGYYYNTTTVSNYTLSYNAGYYTPCGNGYYGSWGSAYVYNNGQWKGGGPLWSGYQWLPS
jgi:hypothetical protein